MSIPKQNILVLDSDPEFLIPLEHVLEEEGFNTTTTWDAQEAIAFLASAPFDALLVGEHPPEVNTAELLKRLQAQQKNIPCIVMQSAARHPFEAQYLCALGACAVVPKWKHKAAVDRLHQVLRPSRGSATRAVAGDAAARTAA